MSETWLDDHNREYAVEALQKRWPGEHIVILEAFDIAWVGWELDYQGALITRDGVPELVIIDSTGHDNAPVDVHLRSKLLEYRRLVDATASVLERYRILQLARRPGVIDVATSSLDEEQLTELFETIAALQRRPNETHDEWQIRYRHFEETGQLKPGPASALLDIGLGDDDLPARRPARVLKRADDEQD